MVWKAMSGALSMPWPARSKVVLYFAGYKKAVDRYKIDEIEAAAPDGVDVINFSISGSTISSPIRSKSRSSFPPSGRIRGGISRQQRTRALHGSA